MLTSTKAGDIAGSRISKQFNDPVKVVVNPEQSVKAILNESTSFFSIDKENIIVTAIKKAEDGKGIAVRLYDSEGENTKVLLDSYFEIKNLFNTNIIEENPEKIKQISVPAYGIETYRLGF